MGTCQGSSGRREELWVPFRCCGEGRGQSWHPRAPVQGWQEVAQGCPCEVLTVAAQPSPSCGRAGEAVCVSLGLQEPLGCRSCQGSAVAPTRGACWVPVVLGGSLGHLLPPWRVRSMARVRAETLSHPCPWWPQGQGCAARLQAELGVSLLLFKMEYGGAVRGESPQPCPTTPACP